MNYELKNGRGEPIWQASAPARSTIETIFHLLKASPYLGGFHGRSGRLTLSAAWQRVAPYSSRRRPAVSPTRQRNKELLLIRRNVTPPALPQSVGLNPNLSTPNSLIYLVGASRFERPTSCSQGRRANQAALRPDPFKNVLTVKIV